MTKVDKIPMQARELTSDQLLRLRTRLQDMEKTRWEKALARTTKEMKRKGIGDVEIDSAVTRRRREGRI